MYLGFLVVDRGQNKSIIDPNVNVLMRPQNDRLYIQNRRNVRRA